jgi:oligopeptide transport system ATP-binding protein
MPDELLHVANLRKVYAGARGSRRVADVVALDDASFGVPIRGALGVVGESGSGKTTAARLLVGLERPTSGTFTIGGADPHHLGRGKTARIARARLAQMVFQDPYSSFDPRQPVAESIHQVLRLHFNMTPQERARRAAAVLEMVGLEDKRARSLPAGLSGGERQRAAIARAIAVEPRLLILDEAVAALDVSIQAQVLNLLVRLRSETDLSYLFLTHDLAVVRQVTDSVIVMREGRIVEHGETMAVLQRPQHPYTRLLLSCVPREGWKPHRTKAEREGLQRAAEVPVLLSQLDDP